MIQGRKLSQHEVLNTAGNFWETVLTALQSFLPKEQGEVFQLSSIMAEGSSRGVLLTCPMHGQQSGSACSRMLSECAGIVTVREIRAGCQKHLAECPP